MASLLFSACFFGAQKYEAISEKEAFSNELPFSHKLLDVDATLPENLKSSMPEFKEQTGYKKLFDKATGDYYMIIYDAEASKTLHGRFEVQKVSGIQKTGDIVITIKEVGMNAVGGSVSPNKEPIYRIVRLRQQIPRDIIVEKAGYPKNEKLNPL